MKDKKFKKRLFKVSGSVNNRIKLYKRLGYDFSVQHTNRTTRIVLDNSVYLYGGGNYKMTEFHLQRDLKKMIRKNIDENSMEVPKYTQDDVKYFKFSSKIKNLPVEHDITDCVEFDIEKAYYKCAFNLGYIDRELYNRCIDLPKHIRLRLIGVIATNKRIYTYKNGVLQRKITYKKDDLLRYAWFHICKTVDDCMREFMRKTQKAFLFYWVDGIYLKNDADYSMIAKELEKKYNFKFTNKIVTQIIKHHNDSQDFNFIDVCKEDEKKPKRFDL